jgi:hypothetical protein
VGAAKPDDPGKGNESPKAGRPEKLEQVIFLHPIASDKPGKPDKPPGKPPKDEEPPTDNTYYKLWGAYLGSTTAKYYINPNVRLVTGGDPCAAIKSAVEAWDSVTTANLFEYAGTTDKNWYALDEQNTISWVKFLPRDYIAIASMWYYEDAEGEIIIYEFDIVFNAFHKWGIDPVKEDKDKIKAFDIQNIAAHEFGHPLGLDDLYHSLYREITMYGYSSKGETIKCSLEEGDILGAQELYNE